MLAPERSLLHERPCRPAPRMLSRPPSRDASFDEAIELTERPPADTAEVMSGTPDVSVQLLYEGAEADLRSACNPAELVLGAAVCLVGDVEHQPPSPPQMPV